MIPYSVKAEYRSFYHGIKELPWLKIVLCELGFGSKNFMTLFCDNIIVTVIVNNSIQHDWTKHIELDRNYIKDKLDAGIIRVPYIKNVDQLTDTMTHGVVGNSYHTLLSKLGIYDIYVSI